ncbi:MAG: recombinase family protein [Zoogloeaceae bacterium]|jgi:DNA invertase Pin-like site-specific DNA recombinase|nr:recombinase family protein [Zoogloeaceae bacterium]
MFAKKSKLPKESHDKKTIFTDRKRITSCNCQTKENTGYLISQSSINDILFCAEFFRLGRSLLMMMEILNQFLKREVQVWTIKDNYRLGMDVGLKALALAFALTAEIERNLASQRTKEALARKRAAGVVLGRPKGHKSARVKPIGKEEEIARLSARGLSQTKIARKRKVHRWTLAKFLRE